MPRESTVLTLKQYQITIIISVIFKTANTEATDIWQKKRFRKSSTQYDHSLDFMRQKKDVFSLNDNTFMWISSFHITTLLSFLAEASEVHLPKLEAEGEFFGPCTKPRNMQAWLNHISGACFPC